MAYPTITARVIKRSEVELEDGAPVRRVATLRLMSPYTYGSGEFVDIPAECLPRDVMVGDEFEVSFFHVRRPKEAADAVRQ